MVLAAMQHDFHFSFLVQPCFLAARFIMWPYMAKLRRSRRRVDIIKHERLGRIIVIIIVVQVKLFSHSLGIGDWWVFPFWFFLRWLGLGTGKLKSLLVACAFSSTRSFLFVMSSLETHWGQKAPSCLHQKEGWGEEAAQGRSCVTSTAIHSKQHHAWVHRCKVRVDFSIYVIFFSSWLLSHHDCL